MKNMELVFGKNGLVRATDFFSPGGLGFVTEKERAVQEKLRVFELNSGFDVPYWYRDEELTLISENEDGCFVDSAVLANALWKRDGMKPQKGIRRIPLCFKVTLPETGNYKVSVTLKAITDEEEVLIFAGRRHLVWKGRMSAGQQVKWDFVMNVCEIIPNGKSQVYTDKTLDLAIVGNCPVLQRMAVAEVHCPTVYLAGDSTMADYGADYPYHPSACYGGWGQAFDAWLEGEVSVCNQAHNGRTTESFRTEGHYDIVSRHIMPGDYFLIQFGHNDQKLQHLQAKKGYSENLKRFVGETRERGAYPVILTPIARNTWYEENGKLFYNDLLYEYAEVCLRVGNEQGVPVLDLHEDSMTQIVSLGREASKKYYYKNDWTHTNDYGAYRAAGYVAGELIRLGSAYPECIPLIEQIGKGLGDWTPQKNIPLLEKPERLEHMQDLHVEEDGEAARNHQAEKEGKILAYK